MSRLQEPSWIFLLFWILLRMHKPVKMCEYHDPELSHPELFYSQVDIVMSCGGSCELHGIVFAELTPVLCDSCYST